MASAVVLRAAVAMTGRFPALAGVDLRVDEGEAVVLTGPNGAGKTSVLRVCAGLLRVSDGEAVVLGNDLVADTQAARREVAMLGHSAALYDDLTRLRKVRGGRLLLLGRKHVTGKEKRAQHPHPSSVSRINHGTSLRG